MADSQLAGTVSSAFPPPPSFYKHFTPENQAALKAQQKLGTPTDQLPAELQFLTPPPPPTTSYRCFGDTWQIPDKLPTLPEMGIPQLYPPPSTSDNSLDRVKELVKLSRSLLLNYLELVGIMGLDPSKYAPKIQDLRTILINMHHLINEYRPHQARETLILMMEEQLERSRRETEENRKACRTVREIFGALPAILEVSGGGDGKVGASSGDGSEDRVKWTTEGGDPGETKEAEAKDEQNNKDLEVWSVLKGMDLLP